MRYSAILASAFATTVLGHGVVTSVNGANGVDLPGLTVQDGTPRDCAQASCGSQVDTAIIRQNELGTARASALGRTNGEGPVDAAKAMAVFMDVASANSTKVRRAREIHYANKYKRGLLPRQRNGGTRTPAGTKETGMLAATGMGIDGLPTTADDGTISMTFHQINQDGAGPITAKVDATSCGTEVSAFEDAEVTTDVPGLGFAGISTATNTDFPLEVQMPAGMTCSGSVAGAENVCVVMVQNNTPAGPFGGSAAFTQSPTARKRAIEFRIKKRAEEKAARAARK